MVNRGRPEEISTSTSTMTPSSPRVAQLITLASMVLGTMLAPGRLGVNEGAWGSYGRNDIRGPKTTNTRNNSRLDRRELFF